jgi:hypothetical protein
MKERKENGIEFNPRFHLFVIISYSNDSFMHGSLPNNKTRREKKGK